MLRKDAKLELLKSVPLFAKCSKRELALIASVADEVDLPEGKDLTREGASGREFVVIVEGAADVRRKGRRINQLGDGDFLGEIALLAGTPRTATVTTTTPVRALVLTGPAFKSLLRRTPAIQLKVLEALAERLPADTV
ncbi:MAG TPA: cyclic nucleotide-binding domain-containing protein [Gaiellaceae bacterium]